jgi:hypothetical protein
VTAIAAEMRQRVAQRAAQRCEYCQLPQACQVATFPVDHVVPRSRAGSYALLTLAACMVASGADAGPPTSAQPRDYTSRAPRFAFADGLPEQEAQLRENPLLRRFREARRKLAADPFRPAYHFSSPEGPLNTRTACAAGRAAGICSIRCGRPKTAAGTGAMRSATI